jgi:hypothetical protein
MGSTLTVDNIKDSGDNTLVSSTGSGHTIASGAFPAGIMIQVVQNNFADNTSYPGSTNTFIEVTEASTAITLNGTNSKILMTYNIAFGSAGDNMPSWQIYEGSTQLPVGNSITSYNRKGVGASGNLHYSTGQYNVYGFNYQYLHTTSSSSGTTLTFKLYLSSRGSDAKEIRLNGPQLWTGWGDANLHTTRSSVTLMEIAG